MTALAVPTHGTTPKPDTARCDALEGQPGLSAKPLRDTRPPASALGTSLALPSATSSLTPKARKVVDLALSKLNDCADCLASHTALAKMNGFSGAEPFGMGGGRAAAFGGKLDALARQPHTITRAREHVDDSLVQAIPDVGWSRENLVDVIVTVGDESVANDLHAATQRPVDVQAAPALAQPIAAG